VNVLGVGVDICDIGRMERALARHPSMRERVFTREEVDYCDGRARPAESFAGRFAAREAVIKALGGIRGARWRDISVARAPTGAPSIELAGRAKARAAELGVDVLLISFAHERRTAIAICLAVGL
jgi:holo-[acyl-carrier protein] synthase